MDDVASAFRSLYPARAEPQFAPGTQRTGAHLFRPGVYQRPFPSEEDMAQQAREAAARAQMQSVRHY